MRGLLARVSELLWAESALGARELEWGPALAEPESGVKGSLLAGSALGLESAAKVLMGWAWVEPASEALGWVEFPVRRFLSVLRSLSVSSPFAHSY